MRSEQSIIYSLYYLILCIILFSVTQVKGMQRSLLMNIFTHLKEYLQVYLKFLQLVKTKLEHSGQRKMSFLPFQEMSQMRAVSDSPPFAAHSHIDTLCYI